jgi:hypothetical protein
VALAVEAAGNLPTDTLTFLFMHDSVASGQDGSLSARRAVALAFVGLLLLSAVGGVVGSSGIVAAQQGGAGGNTTTAGNATTAGNGTTASNGTTAGNGTASGGNGTNTSSATSPVNATIQGFKKAKLGWKGLSAKKKQEARKQLQKLVGNASDSTQNKVIARVQSTLSSGPIMTPREYRKPQQIIKKHLGADTTLSRNMNGSGLPFNIPSLVDQKMRSIADSFKKGAANTLGTIYNLAFSTPVPENDGWHGIFGEPTNATGSGQNRADSWQQVLGISSDKAYQQLHQQLLMDKLYPLLNYVLGIGVVVLGLSLAVNPLMSRFRIINLMVKFVTFLVLYAFSWGVITAMHGVVNDITMWLRPSSGELEALVTSIDKIGAASVAAYFAGSGGILSTVFGMGLELAVRHLALVYFFPYVFPVLVLILYLSPWERLKQFASMGIWQYVNILTMVIPMAVFLKAAVIVDFSPTNGIGGMLVLLALFLLAVVVPIIQTYFFIQIPGTAAWAAKSAGSAAASRLGIGGGDDEDSDDSSADSTATGNASPGERAESAVETTSASSSSNSGVPSSGELSDSDLEKTGSDAPETTAGQVRALDKEQHRDPNSADAKYEAYFDENQANKPAYNTPSD